MNRKLIALTLVMCITGSGFSTGLAAAVIDTQDAVSLQARELRVNAARATLARAEVRDAMIQLGVDPQQAQARVASLSEAELTALEGQLQKLPAGSGALAIVGAVFLVLLILEITGVVDIFKKL